MKNLTHPSFIIAVIAIIVMIIGIGIRGYGYPAGDYLLLGAVALGAIHWVWSVVNVITRDDMRPWQKRFWLIAVIACPLIGGMIFYILHQDRNRLTT